MIFHKNARPGGIALIASLGALSACQTLHAAESSDTPAHISAALNQTPGEGAYYPAISSVETPVIRFGQMAAIGSQQRQSFVDKLNIAASTSGRTVPIVAQAVGENSERLVFLYPDAEGPMTPYLARGILARLTSVTRFAPAIAEMGLSSVFDTYNMASVLGFERIIVTDGREFAHEARIREG